MTKPRSKIIRLLMALLMCMSLFLVPMTAHAGNSNRQPTVEAEIIGSLLRVHVTSDFYEVEAVYINGRRFNHRGDGVLTVDISRYIATNETITVYAVDSESNQSYPVIVTPMPTQPSPTTNTNSLTPDGQGTVLDHLTNEYGIEFITIITPAGNVFYLIIDHNRPDNNVYFLNQVTEWDLLTLAAKAELPVPDHISPPTTQTPPTIIEHEPPVTEEPSAESTIPIPPENEGSSRGGLLIFLLIAGAGAFGVIYYLKILKPKKEREMYGGDEDDELDESGDFEDIDDGEDAYNTDDEGGEDNI